jgi:hypothetical protein
MADLVLLCNSCARFIPTRTEGYSPERQCRTFLRRAVSPMRAMGEIEKGNPFPQDAEELPFQERQAPPSCPDYQAVLPPQ